MMSGFTSINYTDFIFRINKEEEAGRRFKLGELRTSIWLKNNRINLEDVRELSFQLPDSKVVIIGEGKFNGFYIYSEKLKKCFRNYPVIKQEAI